MRISSRLCPIRSNSFLHCLSAYVRAQYFINIPILTEHKEKLTININIDIIILCTLWSRWVSAWQYQHGIFLWWYWLETERQGISFEIDICCSQSYYQIQWCGFPAISHTYRANSSQGYGTKFLRLAVSAHKIDWTCCRIDRSITILHLSKNNKNNIIKF
jgi:hypothetical protein